jgi:hypothetical protein
MVPSLASARAIIEATYRPIPIPRVSLRIEILSPCYLIYFMRALSLFAWACVIPIPLSATYIRIRLAPSGVFTRDLSEIVIIFLSLSP